MSKVLAKTVQFFKGVELMGSKASAQTGRFGEVEVTPMGVKCTSFKSKRTVLVPWANVTGVELFYEQPATPEAPPEPKRGPGRPPKELTQ